MRIDQTIKGQIVTVAIGVFVSLPLAATTPASPPMKPPEAEVADAITSLRNLQRQLKASSISSQKSGFGAQQSIANRALAEGQRYHRSQECLSTIRELNLFFELSQTPDLNDHLKGLILLGECLEETSQPYRALQTYINFLASFLTVREPNYSDLLRVMRRIMVLAQLPTPGKKWEVGKLLSSILSLDVPQSVKPEVYFVAGKTALDLGKAKLASLWLTQAQKLSRKPAHQARALYYRGLIALSREDYQLASDHYQSILALKGKDLMNHHNAARLALGRIAIHNRQPKVALGLYESVHPKSKVYKESLFERVYVLLELGKDQEARRFSNKFLEIESDGREAFQLKTLLAYLDIRSGDLDSAERRIESADQHLAHVQRWVRTILGDLDRLTHQQLQDLISGSMSHLRSSPFAEEGLIYFDQLAEQTRRLNDVRGELRNAVFIMGRSRFDQLLPHWANRAEQLRKLTEEILRIGHRLIATERHHFDGALSKLERYHLQASEERRVRLLDAERVLWRKRHNWRTWSNLAQLNRDLAQPYQKLLEAQAELSALTWHLKSTGKRPLSRREVQSLREKSQRVNVSFMRSLEWLRSKQVASLLLQSSHLPTRRFIKAYAVALHGETTIVERIRETRDRPIDRILARDLIKAWDLWEFLIKDAYAQVIRFHRGLESKLKSTLNTMDRQMERYEQLTDQVQDVRTYLEQIMGKGMSILLSHYESEITRRRAQHQKWRADIEWLRFESTSQDFQQLSEKFHLEKEILRSSLLSLKKGEVSQ